MKHRIQFQQESLASSSLGIVCAVQVLLLIGSFHVFAHQGERIYPIYEITDDMLEWIDLEDGSIEDWEELFDPSLTTLDFTRTIFDRNTLDREIASYDPSDLDFRIWLVWNDKHNRLYVSGQFADDIHVRKRNRTQGGPDSMYLYVDGDHTGGQYHLLTGDRYRDNFVHVSNDIQIRAVIGHPDSRTPGYWIG